LRALYTLKTDSVHEDTFNFNLKFIGYSVHAATEYYAAMFFQLDFGYPKDYVYAPAALPC